MEGRLQTRDWEGEDGVKRYRTEIVADNMIMLDKKGVEGESGVVFDREAKGISSKGANEDFAGMEAKDGEATGGSAEVSSGSKARASAAASAGADGEVKIDDLPF